ncbi:hypothetical protein SpCBS45565_g05553 [Spizellomyces sp. 'palustris']|nr:hypothetical protein SpCBS45565_g05553 [Spizellomyces sp. 'palustris']
MSIIFTQHEGGDVQQLALLPEYSDDALADIIRNFFPELLGTPLPPKPRPRSAAPSNSSNMSSEETLYEATNLPEDHYMHCESCLYDEECDSHSYTVDASHETLFEFDAGYLQVDPCCSLPVSRRGSHVRHGSENTDPMHSQHVRHHSDNSETGATHNRRSSASNHITFPCFVRGCNKVYTTGAGLRYHLKTIHKTITPRAAKIKATEKNIVCPRCPDKAFSTRGGLKYHEKTVHQGWSIPHREPNLEDTY